jgi:hypothetical protein
MYTLHGTEHYDAQICSNFACENGKNRVRRKHTLPYSGLTPQPQQFTNLVTNDELAPNLPTTLLFYILGISHILDYAFFLNGRRMHQHEYYLKNVFAFRKPRACFPPVGGSSHRVPLFALISACGSVSLLFTPFQNCGLLINQHLSSGSRPVRETGALRFHGMLRVINTLCPYLGLL